MKNKITKYLCVALTLLMLFGIMPLTAFAEREVTEGMYTYYISQTGRCIITKGDPSLSGDLVIPDKLGGVPVREIGESAFMNNDNITSITFPETVSEIASGAFCACDALTEVVIPDTVTILGNNAFSDCKNLVSVSTGNGITEIGKRTFHWCNALKNVNIGSNVKTIGEEAFSESKALNSIVIPDSVTEIGRCAFLGCSGLSSVAIGKGVKTIRYRTFKDCYSLGEFVVPDTIEVIEAEAFRGNSITKLIIGKGVRDIGDAFITCDSLQTVDVNDENPYFSSDSEGAVFNKDKTVLLAHPQNRNSDTYTVPEGVKTIAPFAFADITRLKSISLPATLNEFGDDAFKDCKFLKTVYYTGTLDGWCEIAIGEDESSPMTFAETLYVNGNLIKGDIVIPDGTTFICKKAFTGLPLTGVVIPDSVTEIGENAFKDCKMLKSISLGKKLETVKKGAFSGCIQLESVIIPDSVKTIEDSAFNSCEKMKSVTFGRNIEYIGHNAFYECSNAEFSGFSTELKEIGKFAFKRCKKITSFDFGNKLEKVGEEAFNDCELEEVVIPASIKELGVQAFGYCNKLYYCGTQEDWSKVLVHKNRNDFCFIDHYVTFNYAPDDFGTVNVDDISVNYKSTKKLNPTANISPNYAYKFVYSSSDPSVATVDENGNITAVGKGNATITCRAIDENGYSAIDTCTVTVKYSIIQWIINILLLGFLWY